MADFTDQEKDTLDKLRKAFEAEGKTRSVLDPWQEHISRDASVNAAKAALAAKVVEGMSGSWAAQYKYSWGSRVAPNNIGIPPEPVEDIDPLGPPVPIRSKTHHLGKRGLPEINFVPYNWRTNTFGSKGPSLVGHPISFEVVGPTLKSPVMDWTWNVAQGGGPNGGDLLTAGPRPDGAGSPVLNDIIPMYGPRSTAGGLWTIGDASEPNGGLYLIVSDDGANPGSLDTGGGQVPMGALSNFADTARYEVFRISTVTESTIEIHPNKSFSGFFDLPPAATRSIRAITVFRPYVTRLAAIPQSGAAGGNDGASTSGREQVFVTVSPEFAAGNDNFPPFDGGSGPASGDGSWIGGGFTNARAPFGAPIAGEPAAYGARVRLPIPIPVREVIGNVEATAVTPTALVGNWTLEVGDSTVYSASPLFSSRLPVIRVNATSRRDDLTDLTLGSIPNCLGWFDVVGTTVGPDTVVLARVPETDPQTGLTYWGPGPWEADVSSNVALGITFHEAVEALWFGNFRIDKVESARLKNLINPNWVERFEKQMSDPLLVGGGSPPPGGSTAGRPDKAVFDTRRFFGAGPIPEAANPGNLMDLGFRMVLFPAKNDENDATLAVPDFDNPIMGRELTIDASVTTGKQFVEIDYSSGIVRLSIPPPTSLGNVPDEPTDILPNGIPGTSNNNPRGEVILYGACVPYSMEESQLGGAPRVTANRGAGHRDFDLYGQEVFAKIAFDSDLPGATTFTPTVPFIGPSAAAGGAVAIVLDRIWDGPETGVIVITSGSNNSQSSGRWGYTSTTTVTVNSFTVTALLGISSFPTAFNPDPALFPGEQTRGVVLRREVFFGSETFSLPAVTDFYPGDTTYGSEARAQTLRFARAKLIPELDGSITVQPRADLAAQLDRTTGHIQPAKLRVPSDTITNPFPTAAGLLYPAEDGIFKGLSYQADPGHPGGINPGLTYFPTIAGPAPGVNLGPSMAMNISFVGLFSFTGFITQSNGPIGAGTGSFALANNFRFVAKAGIFVRNPLSVMKGFIGFVQDESPPGPGVTPLVEFIPDPATLAPDFSVLGFQFDFGADTTWRYWTRGALNPDNILPIPGANAIPTDLLFLQGPYYFVIETNRILVDDVDSLIVKMGVYDGEKNLVHSITVTHKDELPIPGGRGLFTAAAINEAPSLFAAVDLNIFFMKVILDTEIEDLPPLP